LFGSWLLDIKFLNLSDFLSADGTAVVDFGPLNDAGKAVGVGTLDPSDLVLAYLHANGAKN
jgi:hypothetical protein